MPDLAEEVAELVKPTWVGADIDSWGIDHGTWSVLAHAFPDASIPVVQLSINADKPVDYHFDLGHRDFGAAVPTPDHYIPSVYFAGLAAQADTPAGVSVAGCAYGSSSMTAYTLGVTCEPDADDRGAPVTAPESPADQSNI